MMTILDDIFQSWKASRNSWTDIRELLASPSMYTVLSQQGLLTDSIYYAIVAPLTNTIMYELQQNLDFVEFYSPLMQLLNLALFLGLSFFTICPFNRALAYFYAIFYIIPFGLLGKNLVFRHKMRRMRPGVKFYKL